MRALLILSDEYEKNNDHYCYVEMGASIDMSKLYSLIDEWCESSSVDPKHIRFVFFDGMLYEYANKPVLADVMTGIEI